MSLIKDGNVYRTEYEQIVHLTKKHLEQLNINENVSKQLQELGIAANLGGYNLVRFSFQKSGIFYKLKNAIINIPVSPTTEEEGDFVEFTNGKPDEIPAYGYFINNHQIELYFSGDFKEAYNSIKAYNITKNITYNITLNDAFDIFEGTSLLDYDPNNVKKQVFNVLTDIIYFNAKTQYVSFDVNSDNKYNFIYIGNVKDGENGKSVYTISNISDYNNIVNTLIPGDTLLCGNNITINNVNYSNGSLLQFNSINEIIFKGNIRGSSGKDYIFLKNVQSVDFVIDNIYINANELSRYPENFTTEYVIGNVYDTQNNSWLVNYQIIGNAGTSDTYELKPISYNKTTGIQGPIGPIGPRGPEGPQGIQGPSGITLSLQTGLYNSPSDLPEFSSVPVFNAYRVQNTSGTIVTTDLYFKTEGATDWDIQENWGGIPGPQGPQGPQGEPGVSPTLSIIVNDSQMTSGSDSVVPGGFISFKPGAIRYEQFGIDIYAYGRAKINDFHWAATGIIANAPVSNATGYFGKWWLDDFSDGGNIQINKSGTSMYFIRSGASGVTYAGKFINFEVHYKTTSVKATILYQDVNGVILDSDTEQQIIAKMQAMTAKGSDMNKIISAMEINGYKVPYNR